MRTHLYLHHVLTGGPGGRVASGARRCRPRTSRTDDAGPSGDRLPRRRRRGRSLGSRPCTSASVRSVRPHSVTRQPYPGSSHRATPVSCRRVLVILHRRGRRADTTRPARNVRWTTPADPPRWTRSPDMYGPPDHPTRRSAHHWSRRPRRPRRQLHGLRARDHVPFRSRTPDRQHRRASRSCSKSTCSRTHPLRVECHRARHRRDLSDHLAGLGQAGANVEPWAPGPKNRWIGIAIDDVTGRLLRSEGPPSPVDPNA